jgi:hypothetical protein
LVAVPRPVVDCHPSNLICLVCYDFPSDSPTCSGWLLLLVVLTGDWSIHLAHSVRLLPVIIHPFSFSSYVTTFHRIPPLVLIGCCCRLSLPVICIFIRYGFYSLLSILIIHPFSFTWFVKTFHRIPPLVLVGCCCWLS